VKFLLLCLALLLVSLNNNAIAQPPQEPPADVIELSQEGGVISGYFQGPDQSGPLSGTINQQHILFLTETPNVLTFRGRVDGPRVEGRVIGKNIQGTFHLHNRTAPFHAVRTE
jgi:hypothetical protein